MISILNINVVVYMVLKGQLKKVTHQETQNSYCEINIYTNIILTVTIFKNILNSFT